MARPRGYRTKHLTEAQRQRIRTLFFDAGLTRGDIQRLTRHSLHQIDRTLQAPSAKPKARSGRPPRLSPAQEAYLIEYVCSSSEARQQGYVELSECLFDGQYGPDAIRNALRRNGFQRYVARIKPPISETTRQARLAWALEHKDWTWDQWAGILWSDETWVRDGHHARVFVTRRHGEELDPSCLVPTQRKQGWMFWGSFSGLPGRRAVQKGPGLVWEKEWGSINKESYCQRVVPLIDGWIRWQRAYGYNLQFMQDNAPSHKAAVTVAKLEARRIPVIEWPPFSPDLNPIEPVWNWMKDYLQAKYGRLQRFSYDRFREMVKEAWEAVPDDFLIVQLESMRDRCEAVIAANGMHTRW